MKLKDLKNKKIVWDLAPSFFLNSLFGLFDTEKELLEYVDKYKKLISSFCFVIKVSRGIPQLAVIVIKENQWDIDLIENNNIISDGEIKEEIKKINEDIVNIDGLFSISEQIKTKLRKYLET